MQNAVNESFWDAHGVEIEAHPKTAPKSWVVKRPWLAEALVSHDGLPRLRKSQTMVGPNQGLVTSRPMHPMAYVRGDSGAKHQASTAGTFPMGGTPKKSIKVSTIHGVALYGVYL